MRKVTLAFPDNDSLWTFTDKTNATHISVRPRNNHVSGTFAPEEIDRATNELNAVVLTAKPERESFNSVPIAPKRTPLRQVRQWFQSIDLRF